MPAPYYHLLGHVVLAVEACDANSALADALDDAGFGADQLEKGRKLSDRGQELIDRRVEEAGDDRIVGHSVHSASEEVQMWHQSAGFQVKKAVDDETLVDLALGRDLHAEDHTVEVVARGLRLVAMIRTVSAIYEALGEGQKTRDMIIRGFTLLTKVFRNSALMMRPGPADDADAAVFDAIRDQYRSMVEWIEVLGRATENLEDEPELLGELGYVPEDVGLPLGGTSYSVPLHQKAQRDNPPDPDDVKPAPGWSVGRQGQNSENLGEGWVRPKFE